MNRAVGSQERRGGGRFSAFTDEQRNILLKYFDEYGMTSTKRCNIELISRCADEIGSTVEKIKNWIGSEAVKRKRKAGILPRPKFEFSAGSPELKAAAIASPPPKKIKRVNGYNIFFSDYVQNHAEQLGPDFKERNATVAQKWAELSDVERKQWASKAEIVCSASIQGLQQAHGGLLNSPSVSDPMLQSVPGTPTAIPTSQEENIVEKTLLSIQEKFELLEQLGFEGYSILVNTSALQTHLIATTKGKSYHKLKQQLSKPLENPFIGHVFSDSSGIRGDITSSIANITTATLHSTLNQAAASSPLKVVRVNVGGAATQATQPSSSTSGSTNSTNLSLNNLESMQRSVMNAFSLKYKVATGGRSEVPYDNPDSLGVQIYGMPPGVPFHSPLLYNQQQLQQILANIEKIVFLKTSSDNTPETSSLEVELSQESMSSLVENM